MSVVALLLAAAMSASDLHACGGGGLGGGGLGNAGGQQRPCCTCTALQRLVGIVQISSQFMSFAGLDVDLASVHVKREVNTLRAASSRGLKAAAPVVSDCMECRQEGDTA